MTEASPAEELRCRRVSCERRGNFLPHPFAVSGRVECGEIDDNRAAEPAQPQLPRDHACRREIGTADRALRGTGFRTAGIDVDQQGGAPLVDMDRPATRQAHAWRERAIEQSL